MYCQRFVLSHLNLLNARIWLHVNVAEISLYLKILLEMLVPDTDQTKSEFDPKAYG